LNQLFNKPPSPVVQHDESFHWDGLERIYHRFDRLAQVDLERRALALRVQLAFDNKMGLVYEKLRYDIHRLEFILLVSCLVT
jgi:hypothetical protein